MRQRAAQYRAVLRAGATVQLALADECFQPRVVSSAAVEGMGDAAAADERLGDLHSVAPVDGFGQRVGDGNLRGVPHRCFIMRLTINPDGDEDQMSERPPAALPRRRQGRHGPFPPVRPEDEGLAEFGSGGRLGHEDGRRLQCLGGLLAQSGASGME